nr:hydantoinase B/oxoprolinase family protein [Rhodovulum marinum]
MDLSFSRMALSPVIAEANDRSEGIYSARDGALIAQGAGGLPVFVGTMQYSTRVLIERIAAGQTAPPEPGDTCIVNDPYPGGTHLMDVRLARPFYRGGEVFCSLSNTGHWPNTGGAVPGAFPLRPPASNKRGCACPPSSCSSAARWIARSTRSSVPISAWPTSGSRTSRRRPPR